MAENYDYDLMKEVCVTVVHHITIRPLLAVSMHSNFVLLRMWVALGT